MFECAVVYRCIEFVYALIKSTWFLFRMLDLSKFRRKNFQFFVIWTFSFLLNFISPFFLFTSTNIFFSFAIQFSITQIPIIHTFKTALFVAESSITLQMHTCLYVSTHAQSLHNVAHSHSTEKYTKSRTTILARLMLLTAEWKLAVN